MNMNQLAKKICEHEGLKKPVNIAQVKEILSVMAYVFQDSGDATKCFVDYFFKQREAAFALKPDFKFVKGEWVRKKK